MSAPTTTRTPQTGGRRELPLTHPTLPRSAPVLAAVLAIAAATLVGLLAGWGVGLTGFVAVLLFAVSLPLWALVVEGSRGATDRLATIVMWTAFGVAMLPLVTLIFTVVVKGAPVLSAEFFTFSMRNVIGEGGGIYHAIIGTLLITLFATLISVPVGILAAIYLVEYGGTSRLARTITFLVDVMTGIPSIVAGLFAYALFVLIFGPGVRMGFGGSVALSILMIPIVVRSAEEMLKLVPDELREAAYALGRAQVAHDPQGRAAHGDRRHRHRRDARGGAGRRRDRPAAGHRGRHRLGELQRLLRADGHPPRVHLLLVHPARRAAGVRPGARLGGRARADRDRDDAEPGRPRGEPVLRPRGSR